MQAAPSSARTGGIAWGSPVGRQPRWAAAGVPHPASSGLVAAGTEPAGASPLSAGCLAEMAAPAL